MPRSQSRHVSFVSFVGLRVREQELLALGINLPGLGKRRRAIAELPALGLLTLAGLMPEGWTCSYHEVNTWKDDFIDELIQENPCFVAISALTASIREAYSFAASLRIRGIRTVIGGLHATACSTEAAKYADAVVIGDGEPVWSKLLDDAWTGKLSAFYKSQNFFDLRDSKAPRFDLAAAVPRSRFTVQTQRGCPFACEFCSASRLLGSYREKPTYLVRKELHELKDVVARPVVELADDNTFAGARNQRDFLGVLADADIRYFTETDWRLGERGDVLVDLAASGCVQVLVGVESLVHTYAGYGKKQADLARIMDALYAIQDHGIAVIGCFVLGADGETQASIAQLGQFLTDCKLADVQVTVQTPFPGSLLRKRLVKEGRILTDRDWGHYTLFDVTFVPDSMSVAELERSYRELASVVYSAAENSRRATIRRKIWAKSYAKRHGHTLASLES